MSIIRVTVAQQSCTPKSKQAAREGTFHITINYAKDMSIQVQTDIFVYTFAMSESHGNTGKSVGRQITTWIDAQRKIMII